MPSVKLLVEKPIRRQSQRLRVYKEWLWGQKQSDVCFWYSPWGWFGNRERHPIATDAIEKSFHTDRFAKWVATVKKAMQAYKDVRTTLKLGRFTLLKLIFKNDTRRIPDHEESEAKQTSEAELHTFYFRACNRLYAITLWKFVRLQTGKCPKRISQEAVLFFVESGFDTLCFLHHSRCECASYWRQFGPKLNNRRLTKIMMNTQNSS